MENNISNPIENTENQPSVQLTEAAIDHMDEMRKWALVMAIGGFVSVVMMFLTAISLLISPNDNPAAGFLHLMSGVYFFIAFIMIFPMYFLWKMAIHAKKTVKLRLNSELEVTLKNLKLHYICIGIFSLLSIITIVASIIAAFMSGLITSLLQAPTV